MGIEGHFVLQYEHFAFLGRRSAPPPRLSHACIPTAPPPTSTTLNPPRGAYTVHFLLVVALLTVCMLSRRRCRGWGRPRCRWL